MILKLRFKIVNFQIITMADFNYHLQLLSKSVENFMTVVDLQILVKGCANTS